MIALASSRESAQRQGAADQALACAEALGQDLQARLQTEPLVSRHGPELRRLARESDALGLSCLAEAARLTLTALTVPRCGEGLVGQALDVLTLVSRDARRGSGVRAELYPAVEALREHLRYAGATTRHD